MHDETLFELPKSYDPSITDNKWYAFWEEGGFFKADADSPKPAYTIVIPPPNVTGVLHMGHALVNTLQDILIRWKRMSGYEALWIPGTDHAGIATQTVVERYLIQTEGKKRKDYDREAFLKHVWLWKERSENTILSQLKKMGCSCDWSRLHFTMDPSCNRAVKTIFKKMFDEGLIYRGDYLVNWDPVTQTALADDEVEYEEREGFLWYFKYHLVDGSGYVHIATTRPETMLGDTAIAVSPSDQRYLKLIGKKVRLPFLGREIPIISDRLVDPAFGTGMVKVTPAHDPNDYKMGIEHHLPFINIFTPDGRINENGGPFEGLSREEARERVVKEMQGMGLLEKIERHKLRVGLSYRSKAIIEPYISKQWFVKMDPFIGPLQEVIHKGEVAIIPKKWETTYFHWVDHLRDWCISRQLWWGHRIPVWYHKDNPEQMICYSGEGPPPEVAGNPEHWVQDPDVLDTWFSSALWPFSTLGWPETTKDLKKFYPTSVLVTGHDILFFWVARMILMGKYALGASPFPQTFLHGLIYGKSYWKNNTDGGITYVTDAERKEYDLGKPTPPGVFSKWEKLSKSKGNVIDPLELIADYGTDAMRMSLCACANQSPQIDLDRRKFEEFKNFANKIWNGARFIFMNLEGLTAEHLAQGLDNTCLALEDRWILSAVNQINREINRHLEHYDFDQAAAAAYNFFWKEFCAYYLEITKPILFQKNGTPAERTNKQKLLVIILCNMVRLLHPMAPFITEELFQLLKKRFSMQGDGVSSLDSKITARKDPIDAYTEITLKALSYPACIVAPYPVVIQEGDIHPEIEARFSLIEHIVYAVRNIRGEMKIPPNQSTDLYIIGNFEESPEILKSLLKINTLAILAEPPVCGFSATGIVGSLKIVIPLPAELKQKEIERLEKEREKSITIIDRIKEMLNNPEFHEKAKPELIEKQKNMLEQSELQLQTILEKIKILSSL